MSTINFIQLTSCFLFGNIFYYCCCTESRSDEDSEIDNVIEENNVITRADAYVVDNVNVINLDQQ